MIYVSRIQVSYANRSLYTTISFSYMSICDLHNREHINSWISATGLIDIQRIRRYSLGDALGLALLCLAYNVGYKGQIPHMDSTK